MQVFITGANFGNKGAQSMLFTTVSAIRRNYPDAKIIFAHRHKMPVLKGNFSFDEVYWHRNLFKVSAEGIETNSTPPRGHRLKKHSPR